MKNQMSPKTGKIFMAIAVALNLFALSPALSLAQTQNTYTQTIPSGNVMYGTAGAPVRMMPPQNGQGQIAFQNPMMGQFASKAFMPGYYGFFAPFGFLACGITLLMLWVLMALAIIWLASHLKKNLHK